MGGGGEGGDILSGMLWSDFFSWCASVAHAIVNALSLQAYVPVYVLKEERSTTFRRRRKSSLRVCTGA